MSKTAETKATPKDQKDLLILVPCCRGFNTLVETYRCLKFRQKDPGVSYDVKLVMNTKSMLFRKLLYHNFPHEEIVVTESNGRPGKAHNACLEVYYGLRDQYKYMMMIDGDDFVYPQCIQLVGEAIRRSAAKGAPLDTLFLMRGDFIEAYDFSHMDRWYVANQTCIYSPPLESHGTNMWMTPPSGFKHISNPFAHGQRSLETVGTPARALVFSARIYDKLKFDPADGTFAFPRVPEGDDQKGEGESGKEFRSKLYCERAKLMDDLLCFMLLWHARAHNKLLNVEVCNNMSIYCYNSFHLASATGGMAREGKDGWIKEDAIRDQYWPTALIKHLESRWDKDVAALKILNLGEENLTLKERTEIQSDKIAFLALLTSNLIKGCMHNFQMHAAGARKNMTEDDLESWKILQLLRVYAPFLPAQVTIKSNASA